MPNSPQTPEDILKMFGAENIMSTYGKSLGKGKPFFVDTNIEKDFSYTIFKSEGVCESIKTLPNAQKKYMLDGTFKSCPQGSYNQLLIIYIEYYDHVSILLTFANERLNTPSELIQLSFFVLLHSYDSHLFKENRNKCGWYFKANILTLLRIHTSYMIKYPSLMLENA